jgi:hypothetical protein
VFGEAEEILLAAEAKAADGVKRVMFLANGETIGTATNVPFALTWRSPAAGDYDLAAVVTDVHGLTHKSPRRCIRVIIAGRGAVEARP